MGRKLRDALSFLPTYALSGICNSYDIIGDIAILRLTNHSEKFKENIAETLMRFHKNVKTVLVQTSAVQGDFRLRKLKYVVGEDKTRTIHAESGCLFSVDVAKCYFSPRLIYERMRIASQVREGEIVVNLFAGVGCFSILMAKRSNAQKVYSIDVNPFAVQFMRENTIINRVDGKVVPLLGDAKEIVERKLTNVADRVLMLLPEKAFEYLPIAVSTLKKEGGTLHYHDFVYSKRAESSVYNVSNRLTIELDKMGIASEILFGRVVRSIGPHWFQVVLDVRLKSSSGKLNKSS